MNVGFADNTFAIGEKLFAGQRVVLEVS